MAGRPRKAADDKELRGNPGKQATEEYTPMTGLPERPDGLTEMESAAWDRIMGWLAKSGRAEAIDRDAVLRYCAMWEAFARARFAVKEHGPVIQGRDRGLVKNPAFQVMNDAGKAMDVLSMKLGLTPKDRQNLGITGSPDDPDPFASLGE